MLNVLIQSFIRLCRAGLDARLSQASLAGELLERADACAGRDPRCAAELRGAALAYLGVVR